MQAQEGQHACCGALQALLPCIHRLIWLACLPFRQAASHFRLLGRAVAKALQDGRLLDLPLSPLFYRLALQRRVDLYDIRRLDSSLGGWAVPSGCLSHGCAAAPSRTNMTPGQLHSSLGGWSACVPLVWRLGCSCGTLRAARAIWFARMASQDLNLCTNQPLQQQTFCRRVAGAAARSVPRARSGRRHRAPPGGW